MALPWKDVVSNPEFQALPYSEQLQVRNDYFNDVVAPNIGKADYAGAKAEFNAYADSLKPSAKIGTEQLPTQEASGSFIDLDAPPTTDAKPVQKMGGTFIDFDAPPQPDNSHTLAWGAGAAVLVAVALLAWFKFKKTETTSGVSAAAQSPIHEQTEKCYAEEVPHDLQLGTAKENAMFCTQCGTAINASDKFCAKCGTAVPPARGDSTPPTSAPKPIPDSAATALSFQAPSNLTQQDSLPVTGSVVYAGFWRRFSALCVDNVILTIFFIPASIVQASSHNLESAQSMSRLFILLIAIGLVASAIYFTKMESSNSGATFGKRLLGIKVVDLGGRQLTKGRAFARWIAHLLSYITFYIGFFIQPFTARKQALHDMVAKTVIVQTGQAKASSKIVIAVSVCIVAIFFMGVIAAIAIPAYHDYINKRELSSATDAKQPKTSTETSSMWDEFDKAQQFDAKQPKTSTETVKAAAPTAGSNHDNVGATIGGLLARCDDFGIAPARTAGYSDEQIFEALIKIDPDIKIYQEQGYSALQICDAIAQKSKHVGTKKTAALHR